MQSTRENEKYFNISEIDTYTYKLQRIGKFSKNKLNIQCAVQLTVNGTEVHSAQYSL